MGQKCRKLQNVEKALARRMISLSVYCLSAVSECKAFFIFLHLQGNPVLRHVNHNGG